MEGGSLAHFPIRHSPIPHSHSPNPTLHSLNLIPHSPTKNNRSSLFPISLIPEISLPNSPFPMQSNIGSPPFYIPLIPEISFHHSPFLQISFPIHQPKIGSVPFSSPPGLIPHSPNLIPHSPIQNRDPAIPHSPFTIPRQFWREGAIPRWNTIGVSHLRIFLQLSGIKQCSGVS